MIFIRKLRKLFLRNDHIGRKMRVLYLITLIKIHAEIQNCVSCDIEQEIQQKRHNGQHRGRDIKG